METPNRVAGNCSDRPFRTRASAISTLLLLVGFMFTSTSQGQLPSSVDHSAFLPPVGNQGTENSSHAWALAYYYRTYQEGRARGWSLTDPNHQLSPGFLYNQVAPFNEGTSFAELLPLLANGGCATLADFPYDPKDFTTWPPYAAFHNGLRFRIENSFFLGDGLTAGVIDTIRVVLAQGELVVLQVPVFKPGINTRGLFERLSPTNSTYAMPADEDVYAGGYQALTVVGYDDTAFGGNGGFKVVNSWGVGWGDSGFAWVSYEFIQAFASNIYTMLPKVNYQPTSVVRFNLYHPFWGWNYDNVTVTLGLGDPSNPLWSRVILTELERDSLAVDMAVDLTEVAGNLPPTIERPCWIRIDDHHQEDTAWLGAFQLEHNGTVYDAANVLPLNGPFFSGSLYAYLPSGASTIANYYLNDGSVTGDQYCTATGDDSNDGLSPATPKRSIQSIIDNYTLKAGDTVWIDAGQYSLTNDIHLTQLDRGTSSASLRFVGVLGPNGEPASVIDRGTNGGAGFALNTGVRFIQLENLWIKGGNNGVAFEGSWDYGTDGLIINNTRISNTGGDAIWLYEAAGVQVSNCRIHDFGASGIMAYGSTVLMDRSTIVASTNATAVTLLESGSYYASGASLIVSNSILFASGNGARCATVGGWLLGAQLPAYWSCMFATNGATLGNVSAVGNLASDPLLADSVNGDFHLRSSAGRWDAAANSGAGTFVSDTVDSPSIDAADPFAPVGAEPNENGARLNAGAFGGTAFASRSPPNARYLVVDQPRAGTTFFAGCLFAWRISGAAWLPGETLAAEYSADGGQTWQSIPGASALPIATLSWTWDTSGIPPGTNYLVRLKSNQSGPTVSTNSGAFAIGHHARNYYVNDGSTADDLYCTASGNDANDGLTPATPKATIQALLDAIDLEPGDTVLVDSGTYALADDITVSAEDSGNSDLFVSIRGVPGRSILVRSGTFGSCFHLGTTANIAIENFRLEGGNYGIYQGGYAHHLVKNILFHNQLTYGLYIYRGDVSAIGNTFSGSGLACIYSGSSYLELRNNIFVAQGSGRVCVDLENVWADPKAYRNEFDYNDYETIGGAAVGIYSGSHSTVDAWRRIMGQDTHSLSADPRFVDPAGGDFHLSSTAGSWHGGSFTADALTSQAIDAGDPATPLGAEPTPNGGRVNLGAYGGTQEASKSPNARLLTLASPNGGEMWRGTNSVRWLNSGLGWNSGDTLHLDYSLDGGTTWNPIPGASSLSYTAGEFQWDTLSVPSGARYRVRGICNQDAATTDASQGNFTIHNSPLTYYVNDGSTDGDIYCSAAGGDTNDGLAPATPKGTIQALLDAVNLEPGDTVYIDTGVYTLTNTIEIGDGDNGASNSPVRLVGSTNVAGTVINRNDRASRGINLWYCSFVSLENLQVKGGLYGLYLAYCSDCVLKDCRVYANGAAGSASGGIELFQCFRTVVRNCLVDSNVGYGMQIHYYNAVLLNNTISGNASDAVYLYSTAVALTNNILWATSSARTIGIDYASQVTSDYNLLYATGGASVGNSLPTLGNWQAAMGQDAHSVSMNPLFVNSAGPDNVLGTEDDDYHLASTGGSWHGGTFAADAYASPCVDAGDPATAVGVETLPNGGRINLGAYGGTAQASRSPAARFLVVTSPNGGEIWHGTNPIHWLSTGSSWGAGDTVRLDYSVDGGVTWVPLSGASAIASGAGQFSWNTQAAPSGSRYRVRATCNQDSAVRDTSDANFTVHNTPLVFYVNDGSTLGDVYCTAAGSDVNDGLSPATPKRTIQALLDAVDLEPADTVLLDTGLYLLTNTITLGASDSGASNAPVRIVGSTNATGTIIDRNDTSAQAMALSYCSFIWLENLQVTNALYGTYLYYCSDCALKSCRLSGNGQMGYSSGAAEFFRSPRTLVQNCLLDNNAGYGLQIYYDSAVLLNNTIASNAYDGLYLYSAQVALTNNVFWSAGAGRAIVMTADYYSQLLSDYNLFYASDGAGFAYFNGTSYPTLASWQGASGQDAHSFSADPLFVNPAAGDFHLSSVAGSWHEGTFTADATTSPAIDAGDPTISVGAESPPNGGRINLGTFGGTAQASKSTRMLALDSPAGGEIWRSSGPVRWTVSPSAWPVGDTVSLLYSADDGINWTAIPGATGLAGSLQQFSWNVATIPAGSHYRVRVVHDQSPTDSAASPVSFAIAGSLPFVGGNMFFVNDSSSVGDQFCLGLGSWGNSGLTAATPRASVQAVLDSYALNPGDTIFVDSGTYNLTNDIVIAEADAGSATGEVHLLGVAGKTILDRGAPNDGSSSCLLIGAAYVNVENFSCRNAYYGIRVTRGNCRLLGNTISACGNYGIYVNPTVYLGQPAPIILGHNTVVHSGLGAAVNLEGYYLGGGWYNLLSCDLVNNTILTTAADGIYSSANLGPRLRNNIVQVNGSGRYCILGRDITALSSSDYNDLLAQNGAHVGKVYQADASDLFTWRALTSWDAHSLSADPAFVNAAAGDFHTRSASGHYDVSSGKPTSDPSAWITDAVTSLTIDAGDPTDDSSSETLPNGGRINLGAFGGTAEASRSWAAQQIVNVLSPSGGEVWSGFQAVELRASGVGFQPGNTLSLDYSADAGGTWHTLSGGAGIPYTQTRFWWDTRSVSNGSSYLVRARLAQNLLVQGVSQSTFRIANLVAPLIVTQPQSQSITVGSNATFSVTPNDTIALQYQWRKGAAALAGATTSSLTLQNITTNDAGSYTVVVSNPAGTITSDAAILTVLVPPSITVQPLSQIGHLGESVTFSVTANGTAPLSYQWRKDGCNLTGATGSLLSRDNLTANDAGDYRVVVTNVSGATTSAVATLTMIVPPPNDNFSNRWPLLGRVVSTTGSNVNATMESGETFHASFTGGKSVWWTWTAFGAGSVTVDTIGSTFDTLLGVYTNSSLPSLVRIASDDDGGGGLRSRVTFTAVPGVAYQIAVDGFGGAAGGIVLNLTFSITGTDLTDPLQALNDQDGDGLSDLLEYALGTDSKNPADAKQGLVISTVSSGGNRYVAMEYRRRNANSGLPLQYVPEVSGDGHTWYSDSGHVFIISVTALNDQFDLVSVRDQTPVNAASSRSIRLRVIEN
jgi:parallel beta-helix repeat protein